VLRRFPYCPAVRVALLSDLHGNSVGLDAVLRDLSASVPVDMYVVLGDVVAQGYDPHGTVERLRGLSNVVGVMGNTDRWVLDVDWRSGVHAALGPSASAAAVNELAPTVAAGFAWTHGCLAATGHLDWLTSLPQQQRVSLPSGARMLAMHTSPSPGGAEIEPGTSEAEAATSLGSAVADIVCLGDTHVAMDRTVGDVRVINPGAIGNPRRDLGQPVEARYALLEDSGSGVNVDLRAVSYDTDAVIEAIESSHFAPNPDWLVAKYSP
jgi:predicted phosphodiesterase